MPGELNTKKRIGVFGLSDIENIYFCEKSFKHFYTLLPTGVVDFETEEDIDFDLDSLPEVFNVKYGLEAMHCYRMVDLIKSLDHSIVLFENDIDTSMDLIKFIFNVNPTSLMIILNKYQDSPYGMLEYVDMQFSPISEMVTHLYFINNKDYDWNELCEIIKTDKPIDHSKLFFFPTFA